GGTADRNRSHWRTSKTPSYTKSVSWQHHLCYQRISNLLEIITVVIFSEAAHHLTMSYQQYFVKDIYNVKTHQKRYSTLNMADVLWYPCSPS
ncbi:hypothetical protein SM969_01005, partial [Escherichia coli]|nr:hypothetical protein [Escherichia coli]